MKFKIKIIEIEISKRNIKDMLKFFSGVSLTTTIISAYLNFNNPVFFLPMVITFMLLVIDESITISNKGE